MTKVQFCPTYALVIKVPHPLGHESNLSTQDILESLEALVNDHTVFEAYIDYRYSDPIDPED